MHKDNLTNEVAIFVGAPNSGKTTLYNWVTGSRYKTVNYPGATVDFAVGKPLGVYKVDFDVYDTPGIYSLSPKTSEEDVTCDILFNGKVVNKNKVIVAVVDATHFTRQILLADHLIESGFNVIIAVTMVDLLKKEGFSIDIEALSDHMKVPVVGIDGQLGGNVDKLTSIISKASVKNSQINQSLWDSATYSEKFKKYDNIKNQIILSEQKNRLPKDFNVRKSEKIDKWILHPAGGLFIFFLVMFAVFSSVFWLAAPAIDFVDGVFSDFSALILSLSPESLFLEFIANGLITGVGAFAVFIPQIAILFLGLCLLEDSGYLARASTLIDKPLSMVGMNGRSFVPILSSFACAVPGMMAARTIPNKKERFVTLFILPLLTCSARIPVYALLIAFLFSSKSALLAGLVMSAIYFLSIIIGAITAAIINQFLPKTEPSFFALELPAYRRPVFRKVIKSVLDRTLAFVKRAGPVILILSVLIWAGSTFPKYEIKDVNERFKASYAASFGKVIEPVFKPMGADWRVGLGIITSFAAREVFVSSLAVVFNVTEDNDDAVALSLLEKMREARFVNEDGTAGELIFTWPAILALVVFFMIALQCMATVSIAISEFGSFKMALIQLTVFNILAYVLSVGVYQIFS